MSKDELILYIYNNMSKYRNANMYMARKSGEAFWRVYESRIPSGDSDIMAILDSFIENSFKKQKLGYNS